MSELKVDDLKKADMDARAAECASEIAAVLAKHGCYLMTRVTLDGDHIRTEIVTMAEVEEA